MIPIEILYEEARNLTTDLLPRIHEEDTEPAPPIETHGKHVFQSTPPWNTPAMGLYFQITGDAQRAESALTLRLFGHTKYRHPGDPAAIPRVPILIAHAREKLDPDDGHEDTANDLLGWARDARRFLDEALPHERRWAKAPGNLVCPHCDTRLELPPGWEKAADLPEAHCRACEKAHGQTMAWEPGTWLAVIQPELDTHITEPQAIHEYDLAPSQIRVWHHREPFTDIIKIHGRRGYPRTQIEARIAARHTDTTA